jgi:Asp-tRNA(Asn)/Glu-tRNA(Gln) amidotransferase A subunit family amidase
MEELNRLSASELAAALKRHELRAIDVTEHCLERIAARESVIHAWISLDPAHAREQALALDAGPIRGPLHGVPIGVKDIIDTADFGTQYGSAIYRAHRPAEDAACVAAARAAGAVVLGKTVTTEFAHLSPAATVNPHDLGHTPGGSSSGSAAAVADAMVPLAFGTQTGGSIIRPASFCGVVGYKPSFGLIGRAGVKLLAESLDTIGALARTVADAALFVGALTGRDDLVAMPRVDDRLQVGVCRPHAWSEAASEVVAAIEQAERVLAAAGAAVRSIELPRDFGAHTQAHADILGYEAVRNLADERRDHGEHLSPAVRELLEAGDRVTATRYRAACAAADTYRRHMSAVLGECHVLLTPSSTGEAPAGLESTGSPVMNRLWTLLHVPCVGVPWGRGPRGLPVGLQVVGRLDDDARTLAAAQWIHEQSTRAFS